jgi:hypothetical protein
MASIRRSRAEWAVLVDRWRQSGLIAEDLGTAWSPLSARTGVPRRTARTGEAVSTHAAAISLELACIPENLHALGFERGDRHHDGEDVHVARLLVDVERVSIARDEPPFGRRSSFLSHVLTPLRWKVWWKVSGAWISYAKSRLSCCTCEGKQRSRWSRLARGGRPRVAPDRAGASPS